MKIYKLKKFFSKTRICIVGGGTAGLDISAKLNNQIKNSQIHVFQPSPKHYYQSGFVLYGVNEQGSHKLQLHQQTKKLFQSNNVKLIPEAVKVIDPQKNKIQTESDKTYQYDQLIIASGLQNDWKQIGGARQALQDSTVPVVSVYQYDYSLKMRKILNDFKGGNVVFSEPKFPFKGFGASQSTLYLTSNFLLKNKVNSKISYVKVSDKLFPIERYNEPLMQIIKKYDINIQNHRRLTHIQKQVAYFQNLKTNKQESLPFDLLHIVPPVKPSEFIKRSGLSDENGYVNVNSRNLQHIKYKNIWSFGDCANLPTSKTAAALFTQSQTFIKNFINIIKNNDDSLSQNYDGYSCQPIYVGQDKLLLTQFKYNWIVDESFYRQYKPGRLYYILNKQIFPYMYWNYVPKGKWAGKQGLRSW